MTGHELKARIKELADEGAALRASIQDTSGPERHALWNEKRRVGRRARAALLAYAFLRGVPHARMEPRWRPSDLLHAAMLARRWEDELGIHVERVTYAPPAAAGGLLRFFRTQAAEPLPAADPVWTESRLAAWLKGPMAGVAAR